MSANSQFTSDSFDAVVEQIVRRTAHSRADQSPCIIGIAGGSASGKTTLARHLAEVLGAEDVSILSLDDFQLGWDFKDQATSPYRWDDPRNFTPDEVTEVLRNLRASKPATVPRFNLKENVRVGQGVLSPARFVIFEGLYALLPQHRELLDVAVYVDAPYWGRLIRRIFRFTSEVDGALGSIAVRHMLTFVRRAHREFVRDQIRSASIVLHDPYDFERETVRQFNLTALPESGVGDENSLREFALPDGVTLRILSAAKEGAALFTLMWEGRRIFQSEVDISIALLAQDVDWFER
jgi:uridine kinase